MVLSDGAKQPAPSGIRDGHDPKGKWLDTEMEARYVSISQSTDRFVVNEGPVDKALNAANLKPVSVHYAARRCGLSHGVETMTRGRSESLDGNLQSWMYKR